MLDREYVLKNLRDCYLKKDLVSLKRKFYLYNYFLTEEDKKKILPIINTLHPMVEEALKKLGGKLV